MYQLNEQQASVGENEELRELITARKGANGHNLANSDCPTLSQRVFQALACVREEIHTSTSFM